MTAATSRTVGEPVSSIGHIMHVNRKPMTVVSILCSPVALEPSQSPALMQRQIGTNEGVECVVGWIPSWSRPSRPW